MEVAWTSVAIGHLEEIEDFIAVDSPKRAHRIANDIIDRVEALLGENPSAGKAGRVVGTREFVLSRTPFIIVYRLQRRIEIVAVVHGAREWPEEF